jgi:hypothetical protein
LNPPNVFLVKSATSSGYSSTVYLSQTSYVSTSTGRVAGIFLSQLPYTGVLADYGSLILFIIGVLFWGALVALIVHKDWHKKFIRFLSVIDKIPTTEAAFVTQATVQAESSPIAGGNPYSSILSELHTGMDKMQSVSETPVQPPIDALVDTAYAEYSGIEKNDAYLTETFGPKVQAPKEPAGMFMPETKAKTWMKSEPIHHTLPTLLLREAQKSKVIISDEGFDLIMNAGNQKEEESRQILAQLVAVADTSYPRIGGWLTLGEREIRTILFSTYMSMTAVFIGWMARGEKGSAFAFIRTLKQQGHSVEVFLSEVITLIDGLYRYRIEGDTIAYDPHVEEVLSGVTNDKLQELVASLIPALDQGYRSADTAAKMALIKIFSSTHKPQASIAGNTVQTGKNEQATSFRTPSEYIR